MNFLDWFKPGIRIKRWLVMGALGLSVFVLGVSKLLFRGPVFGAYTLMLIYMVFVGIALMYGSLRLGLQSILTLVSGTNSTSNTNRQRIGDLLYEQRLLIRGPRVVVIGGGTGLSTMLRGLKEYTSNITAIVTVADDGGGSGKLRETLGMLPPGDIRNCLVALAHTEPVMEELMQYRFSEGNLKGQSFGNLFIAAMSGISSNFEEAIKKMSEVLAVKGKVVPVTLEDVTLCAELENGSTIKGESNIPVKSLEYKSKIKRVYLEPGNASPLEEALYAIDNADCIVIGPGSLFTSILPNLVIKEITHRIKESSAIKIYISNIMTQPGETDGFRLSDHLNVIKNHCGDTLVDFIIANNGEIPEKYYEIYKNDGQNMVEIDEENIPRNIKVITEDLIDIKNNLLRHNTRRLSITIMTLILKYFYPYNRRKILDYYYLSERIKDKKREVK